VPTSRSSFGALFLLTCLAVTACGDSSGGAAVSSSTTTPAGTDAAAKTAATAPSEPGVSGATGAPGASGATAGASSGAGQQPVEMTVGGMTLHMEGNTITSREGAAGETLSVVEIDIRGEAPLKITVKVDPQLAPQLLQEVADQNPSSFAIRDMGGARVALAMTIARPSFTVAGRTIDVTGGRLTVCGIAMGTIRDRDVLTLTSSQVRVEDVFRGPLPAPQPASQPAPQPAPLPAPEESPQKP
jgi:hypothetical protein